MDREEYARFLSAQGLRILRFGGELWVEKRKFFFENIPPHRRIHLGRWDASKLFLSGAAVIRYSCDETEGRNSFEYVCEDKTYDLHSLDPNGRRRTRRGLEHCAIRRIDFDLLAECGCAINRSVFDRQGRVGRRLFTDERRWKQYMAACGLLRNVEAYGAFVGDRLCGYSMAVFVDDYAYLHHTHSYAESLKFSPINALTFTVVKGLLQRPEVKRVSQGLEPFVPLPEVERFKISMGFQRRSIGRRVVANPLALPLFSSAAERIARALVKRRSLRGLLEDFLTFTQALRSERLGPIHFGA